MNAPRVVFLGHTASLSGAELFLLRLLERRPDVRASVVLFDDGPLRERLARAEVSVRVLRMPAALRDLRSDGEGRRDALGALGALPSWFRSLVGELREADADLVYTNSAKAHVLGAAAARRAGLPVLMHVHNGIDAGTYGGANRVALHRSARLASSLLVNSEATRATLRPSEADRAELCYCPTEVPPAPPAPRTPTGHDTRAGLQLAVVGRISEWKGQSLAIDALARLRASVDAEAELHVYGDALFTRDLAYRDHLVSRTRQLALDRAVHWHGHVDDVPAALVRHDVLVHTSVVAEPLGQVVLEGLAAARPVVAAAAGGPLELVDHDVTGLLYRPGDVDDLVRQLSRLVDPDLRTRLGSAAWDHARRFSYDTLVPRWTDLVHQAAGRRPPARPATGGVS